MPEAKHKDAIALSWDNPVFRKEMPVFGPVRGVVTIAGKPCNTNR
jgi:hypothetical protein